MNNVTNNESEQQNVDGNLNYIEAIKEMKAKSVPKEQYDKLFEENAKLVQSLMNGETVENPDKEVPVDINALRVEMFGGKNTFTNLEYCTKALQLRKAILDSEGTDIFVASNSQVTPTSFDYERAQAVADVMQECIEYADGDSEAFTNELMRRTNDVMPQFSRR